MRWVGLVLLLVPLAAGQPGIHNDPGPARTVLYVHGVPHDEMFLNTQEPEGVLDRSLSLAAHSQTCVDVPAVGLARGDRHTWYARPTPGTLWYGGDENIRFEQEVGIARDLRLDTAAPARLVWYMEGVHGGGPSPLSGPVVLEATLREGVETSVGHALMDAGRPIAGARTEPALLAGPATPDHPQVRYVPVEQDGETRHVYEFTLDLPYAEPGRGVQASAADGFHLRVEASVENPACDEGKVMPGTLALHAGDGHRPRLSLDVLDPLRITHLTPLFLGDGLVVHAGMDSPWGHYDVRGDAPEEPPVSLAIEGPTEARSLALALFSATPARSDHHVRPLEHSWVWPYREDGAADGLYTVRLTVHNDQGTATSTAVATFEVGTGTVVACTDGPDGPRCTESTAPPREESPGAGAPVAVGLLAVLVALRRRS